MNHVLIETAVAALVATAACSGHNVVVGNDMNGSGSGSAVALGIHDTCTAQPPPGYLNPNNLQFVASPATGADVLALLAGPYAGRYSPTGKLSSTALTTAAQYNGGAVLCSGLQCSCDPPGPCSVDRCSGPVVSVEVDQTITTADGTFDEQLDSMISSPENDGKLHFTATLPAAMLHGTYQVTLGPPSQVSLEFDGVLATAHVTGSVDELAPTMTVGAGLIQ